MLPNTLWNMKKLRHLHIDDCALFSLPDENSKNCFDLWNLETFSTLFLSSGQETEKILRKLPNIRKLKCIFLGSSDSIWLRYQTPALDFLGQLESLKLLSSSRVRYHLEFNFTLNLKKPTQFCLPWTEISAFAKLPNLEVLNYLRELLRVLHGIWKRRNFQSSDI